MHSVSGDSSGAAADFLARQDTDRPALLFADRTLYQLRRPVTGDVTDAIRTGCALLAPEGRLVGIRMNV